MSILQASKVWVVGRDPGTLVNAADDVEDVGPWSVTFSTVNVKAVGAVTPPTAQEVAAGVLPWNRVLASLCESTVRLTYGAQGTEDIVVDYPVTGGVLSVFASSIQVASVVLGSVITPIAFYQPIGQVTLARGERVAPRRRWTQTRRLVFDVTTGVALSAAPMRAAGYRILWHGTTDGTQLPASITVEQVSMGSGQAWVDRWQTFGFYGGAGAGSNLHRDNFVPLVDGATLLRVTQPIADPAAISCDVQWLLDL